MSVRNPRPAYFRVLLTFARNSLVGDMTFRGNFLIETISSLAWVVINLAFYVLIFRFTLDDRSRTAAGASIKFFMFFATGLLINSLVHDALYDEPRRAERPDPHRGAGLRAAEADRRPVPRLAAADRLVVAGQFRLRAGAAAGRAGAVDCRPGAAAMVLYPSTSLRRGRLLQLHDRPGGRPACGWAAT